MTRDVVVIGAGAVGLAVAFELLCRGRGVTIIDRDWIDIGDEKSQPPPTASAHRSATSWAAAGILPPANLERATDPLEQLRGLSHQIFPEFAQRLKAESGIDCELDRCGGWYLADTPGEIGAMIGMTSYWHDLGIECDETSLTKLAGKVPALSDWVENAGSASVNAKAWWVPDEYQIRSPLYLKALARACVLRGADLIAECAVTDLNEDKQGTHITLSGEQGATRNRVDFQSANDPSVNTAFADRKATILANQVVVCGGCWTGGVARRLKLEQSIVPVRGQILLLKTETPIFESVVNVGHRYFVPRRDGHVLVGSCEEEVGQQHGTTPAALSDLRQFIHDVCPSLRSAREINAWSGLRPMTFDGFPMCGKLPDSESIYVASGHFRSGVHLSPGTAHCIASLMCGTDPPMNIDAFRVGKQQVVVLFCC